MLDKNFDRLRVLSVLAQVSVDEEGEGGEERVKIQEPVKGGKQGMHIGKASGDSPRQIRRTTTISPRRSVTLRPKYVEAVGDARLAWQWVEGWRARLRRGGDVVEKARWEWRLDRQAMALNNVPVVVVSAPGEDGREERIESVAVQRDQG